MHRDFVKLGFLLRLVSSAHLKPQDVLKTQLHRSPLWSFNFRYLPSREVSAFLPAVRLEMGINALMLAQTKQTEIR